MDSVSPVWTDELQSVEHVMALDDPRFIPLVGLLIRYADGQMGCAVRFRLNQAERKLIAEGGDLVITELVSDHFTPLHVEVLMPNTAPSLESK